MGKERYIREDIVTGSTVVGAASSHNDSRYELMRRVLSNGVVISNEEKDREMEAMVRECYEMSGGIW